MTSILVALLLAASGQKTGQAVEADISNRRVTATGSTTARAIKDAFRDLYGHAPGAPNASADGRAALVTLLRDLRTAGGKRVTWVGDSITEQGKTAGQGFTYQIEQLYPGITYSNQGVGGETTLDVITRLATITATNADLYVLAIGLNDARYNDARGATTAAGYVANITTIVNALKVGGKQVAVLSIWPTYWKDQFSALGRKLTDDRYAQWNAALAAYCAGAGVPFVNAYDAIRAAVDLQNVTTLAPDGVHPDYNGAAYIGTAGAKLYAAAILGGDAAKGRVAAAYQPTGAVFYKLIAFDNGAASDWISVQNINPGAVSEFFAHSGNPAVDPTNLFGAYNAAAAGFLNKAADWPAVLTFSTAAWAPSVITAARGDLLGIKAWELYVSTDPRALVDPAHPSWVLHTRETATTGYAHNLMPARRTGVFYRLQIDSSKGTDGPGGTTGHYVKVWKIWGGTPPVRWMHTNGSDLDEKRRTDLVFSATGGDSTTRQYLYNALDTYPYHVMWEAEAEVPSLVITSDNTGGATARGIKDWKLYQSRDPAAIADAAHASWVQIASGSGDQTIPLAGVASPIATLTANSATPDVTGGRRFVTANTAPTTLTSLTGGVDGQEVTIVVNDVNTTFSFTGGVGKFKGNGGRDFVAPQYSAVRAVYSATLDRWLAVVSSNASVSGLVSAGAVQSAQVSASPANAGSATPNLNSGDSFIYTAGAGVSAFTINAPVSMSTGARLTVTIKNASGGAFTTTWNAAFKLATWTDPATGQSRSITFGYNGTNWVELSRTAADVPN